KMVTSKNMEGLQWFAQNAWKSDLTQHFMLNSIPRFILLDEEGKIIDPSAERPSGKIRETLEKHLADKDTYSHRYGYYESNVGRLGEAHFLSGLGMITLTCSPS